MASPQNKSACERASAGVTNRTVIKSDIFQGYYDQQYFNKKGELLVGPKHNKAARGAIRKRLVAENALAAKEVRQAIQLSKKVYKAPSGKVAHTVTLNGEVMDKADVVAFIDSAVKRVAMLGPLFALASKRPSVNIDALDITKLRGRHAPYAVRYDSPMHRFGVLVERELNQQYNRGLSAATAGLFTQSTFDCMFRWYYMSHGLTPAYFPQAETDFLIGGNYIRPDAQLAAIWPGMAEYASRVEGGLLADNGCFLQINYNALPSADRVKLEQVIELTQTAPADQRAYYNQLSWALFTGDLPEQGQRVARDTLLNALVAETQFLGSPTVGLIAGIKNSAEYKAAKKQNKDYKERLAAAEAQTPQGQAAAAQKAQEAAERKRESDAAKSELARTSYFKKVPVLKKE